MAAALARLPFRLAERHTMAASTTALRQAVDRKDWTLAQTMIRVKDPAQAVPFFEKLGFRLLE